MASGKSASLPNSLLFIISSYSFHKTMPGMTCLLSSNVHSLLKFLFWPLHWICRVHSWPWAWAGCWRQEKVRQERSCIPINFLLLSFSATWDLMPLRNTILAPQYILLIINTHLFRPVTNLLYIYIWPCHVISYFPVCSMCYIAFSPVRLCATPWIAVCQAPLSMGFSRQGY